MLETKLRSFLSETKSEAPPQARAAGAGA
jgi:hypothetical protein